MFKIKSIYKPTGKKDGYRILVSKSWPEGLPSDETNVDLWLKEIAPTKDIDEWIVEDSVNFDDFKIEYQNELRSRNALIAIIRKIEKENGMVTLLHSAHDPECNCARVLRDKLKGYGVVGRAVGRIHGG
jgi:uncharacterized protein YeaO (DUF488 family)